MKKLINNTKKNIRRILSVLVCSTMLMSSGSVFAASNENYPNDPYLGSNWQYASIGIDKTWNAVDTDNEIVVAVIDTGLDVNNEDFQGRISEGYDYIRNTSDMIDTDGHGTMVSSTIAAIADNGIGIAGSAGTANVKIAPYRIADGKLDNEGIYNAIMDAANRDDVRIINLSFGSYEYNTKHADAIAYAISQGKIIVGGAGNHGAETSGDDPYYYPASYEGVLSVGSTGLKGELAYFSQSNDQVDFYVPGESLMVLYPDNGYGWQSGTSFSAGIVSGIIASMLAEDPSLTAADVESILIETSESFSDKGQVYGYGSIQADKALEAVKDQSLVNIINAQAESLLIRA